MHNQKISAPAVVILLALGGSVALLAATRFGIGIYPDSVVYLDAASSLSHGAGLSVFSELSTASKPLTHFPPLYSSVLALIGVTGVDLSTAARWLNAFLFGANILIVGLMIRRYARDSFWLPVLGSFIALAAPDIVGAHSFALSEALFILLTMIGLHWLTIYSDSQRRAVLVAAALAIGMSVLTRYIGAASICAGTLVVLIFRSRDSHQQSASAQPARSPTISYSRWNLRTALTDAVIFGSIACAPMGLWAVRNRFAAGRATDQPFVFHPIRLHHFVAAFSTVAQWLLLDKVRHNLRAIGFLAEVIAIIVLTVYLLWQRRRAGISEKAGASARLPYILTLFIVCYLALMIFSLSFVDASIVFDSRHLVPVHVAVVVLVFCLGWRLYVPLKHLRSARLLIIVPALVLAVFHGVRGVRWFESTRHDGQGYASREWRESPTIALVEGLPPGGPIYSNGFDAIYYLTGRRALSIPEKTVYLTGEANPKYDVEIERIRNDLQIHKGAFVYFETLPERSFLPSERELRTQLHLIPTATVADGSIYETNELAR